MQAEVAVVGAGVVGCASALELARRGAEVILLEAEPEPGLQASGTNSGLLHTGFDSVPGQLETEMILRSAQLREPLLEALGIRVQRCGALMVARDEAERAKVEALASNAARNGVEVRLGPDGLEVPGEAVTDPVAYTGALAAAAQRHGAALLCEAPVIGAERGPEGFELEAGGRTVRCGAVVNCAGLGAGRLARALGDDSFDVYPRKGEFLVFDDVELERILLPVPSAGTKGVLVFPTLDGKVIAGPTAVDGKDPRDWSVRAEARSEILAKAEAMHPPLAQAEPCFSYAGLRPAGRGVNYVLRASTSCDGLVHAAAIRSTGLTASPAIAERVAQLAARAGLALSEPRELAPAPTPAPTPATSWWRRSAEHFAA